MVAGQPDNWPSSVSSQSELVKSHGFGYQVLHGNMRRARRSFRGGAGCQPRGPFFRASSCHAGFTWNIGMAGSTDPPAALDFMTSPRGRRHRARATAVGRPCRRLRVRERQEGYGASMVRASTERLPAPVHGRGSVGQVWPSARAQHSGQADAQGQAGFVDAWSIAERDGKCRRGATFTSAARSMATGGCHYLPGLRGRRAPTSASDGPTQISGRPRAKINGWSSRPEGLVRRSTLKMSLPPLDWVSRPPSRVRCSVYRDGFPYTR